MSAPSTPQPLARPRRVVASDGGATSLRRRPPRWRSATSFRRGFAALVDVGLGVATTAAGFWGGVLRVPRWAQGTEALPALEQVAVQAATLPLSLWNVWMGVWLPWLGWLTLVVVCSGRTAGQWAAGVRLVDADGGRPNVVQRLAWGLAHVLWPASLGLLATAGWVSRSRRGLPERVSATWAVTSPPANADRLERTARENAHEESKHRASSP